MRVKALYLISGPISKIVCSWLEISLDYFIIIISRPNNIRLPRASDPLVRVCICAVVCRTTFTGARDIRETV